MILNEEFFRQVREAIQYKLTRPPQEWFDRMVELGVLNEKGEVLIRMPESPKAEQNGEPSAKRDLKTSSDHAAE